jgi:predicted Mrr-cat superfamily restriction endonuclease
MGFWGVCAGKHGEAEEFALANSVVVIGWNGILDANRFSTIDQLKE